MSNRKRSIFLLTFLTLVIVLIVFLLVYNLINHSEFLLVPIHYLVIIATTLLVSIYISYYLVQQNNNESMLEAAYINLISHIQNTVLSFLQQLDGQKDRQMLFALIRKLTNLLGILDKHYKDIPVSDDEYNRACVKYIHDNIVDMQQKIGEATEFTDSVIKEAIRLCHNVDYKCEELKCYIIFSKR